ncbi:MAG: hypothetical protein RL556_72 [Actinomycetota bacterium]|jgi:pyridoxal phosphate enzyme (YggS family)
MTSLQERLEAVQSNIALECAALKRDPREVTLIVVTKNHSVQLVRELISIGHRDFGENRDQEAAPKARLIADENLLERNLYNWHFIGQLQTNKVKSVLRYADAVHSLDRESLLAVLQKECLILDRKLDVFIQLNLTQDDGRGGLSLDQIESFTEQVLASSNLNLKGVMGVASLDAEPAKDFELIANASARVQKLAPSANQISAGMSGDYLEALKYGATHLRIGTAITGNRQY